MKLTDFLEKYPPTPPVKAPDNSDQLRKLGPEDGVCLLSGAPATNTEYFVPEKSGDKNCHLWVIDATGIPYILERAQISPPLESGVVKHSNLTGGDNASCGGELWFETPNARKIYFNGWSGRYLVRNAQQLTDAEKVLKAQGFDVISFGWDEGTDKPARVLRHGRN